MQVDSATAQRYARQAPELLEAVTGDGDERMMRRDALSDYCVKFEQGLCGIQKKHGPDFLSDACHFYPRMTRGVGGEAMMTGALSCPEIARLALFSDEAFTWRTQSPPRLPSGLTDYKPESLTTGQAYAIHEAFLSAALAPGHTAPHNVMRLFAVAESLERLPVTSWPEAVPFYLEHAASRLRPAVPSANDPFFLLQSLCGLIAAAKKGQHARLMENVRLMESALHVTIQWDTLAIAHLPDSLHAASSLAGEWERNWAAHYEALLRRYLAAQLSLALFPFAGLGDTLSHRMAIIAIRFATVRLTLMSACRAMPSPPAEHECVRIVQSLSRFLDHLAGAEFSLTIYGQAGWLETSRLRALVGDLPPA